MVEIPKRHGLCPAKQFRMSAHMQQVCCTIGSSLPYERASRVLELVSGIAISGKQIERVCKHVGTELREREQQSIVSGEPVSCVAKKGERTYVMADGSMILTRERGWMEMKVGRIFAEGAVAQLQAKRAWIRQSQYVSHLGGHEEFIEKMDHYAHGQKRRVFLSDGAVYLSNWISAQYPQDTRILDYYHASEHLWSYANSTIRDTKERSHWVEQQQSALVADGVEDVMQTVRLMQCRSREQKEKRRQLIGYLERHKGAMLYGTYRKKNLHIGSGAIESAHRTLIQQRMKLSGQRWSIVGAQSMAMLRCSDMSGQYSDINNVILANFKNHR